MAYTAPTASDLIARFPAFAAVDTDVISTALDEAANASDDSWVTEVDYRLARMLYAAHNLTIDGHGTGMMAEMASAGALGFSRVKSGELEFQADASGGAGGISSTTYGRRYMELLRRNRGGAFCANSTI